MTISYSPGFIEQTNEAGKPILSTASGGTNIVTFTVIAHGYADSDFVDVQGTTDYNRGWEISNVTPDTFDVYFPADPGIAGDTGIVFTSSQTGTVSRGDKDPTGLDGLTGVTTINIGGITQYVIDSATQFRVLGALLHDPDLYIIVINKNTADGLRVYPSGRYNYGKRKIRNGKVFYSDNRGLYLTYVGANVADPALRVDGHLTQSGGVISSQAATFFVTSSTYTGYAGEFYNSGSTPYQLRIGSNNPADDLKINFYNITLSGRDFTTVLFVTSGFGTGNFGFKYAVFQTSLGPTPDLTLTNFATLQNTSDRDISVQSGSVADSETITIQDFDKLPSVFAVAGTDYIRALCRISLDFVDQSDAVISEVSAYGVDINNGQRALGPKGQDDTADIVYSALDQTTPIDLNVLIYVYNYEQGRTPYSYLDDRRNVNGNIPFIAYAYGYRLLEITPTISGLGVTQTTSRFSVDPLIVETDRAVVDVYTIDLDYIQLYDFLNSYLGHNLAGETSTIISRDNAGIDARSYDVVIDKTKLTAPTFGGVTITLGGDFTGNIVTTGTVTLLNSPAVNGFIDDANGVTTYLEIT